MKTRNEVLDMVRAKIRLRHYSLRTEDAYSHWIGRYYDFCRTRPGSDSSERKAEAFLTMLAQRYVAAKTQNQALCALVFLYKEVLGTPLGQIDAMRAKRPQFERVAPSREQVRLFRSVLKDTPLTPVRLLVDLIYGCGLRVCEPLDLRVQDILWGEGHLVIRAGKGHKDRRVPIPAACAEPLRRQVDRARCVWQQDRERSPQIGVPLPRRLSTKYPRAASSWQWFWVFPAAGLCRDPLTNELVRFRLLEDALQRPVHQASLAAGLGHLISPHVLRHAYATHSREPIERLRQLMGHSSIETTAGYRHVAVDGASNPLDDLLCSPAPTASPHHVRVDGSECPATSGADATLQNPGVAAPARPGGAFPPVRWKYRRLEAVA